MTIQLSPKAQADLDDIWTYTEQKWNAAQAENYVRQIAKAFDVIATEPRRGRDSGDIRPGYRKYLVGSHVIFFRVTASYVDVVRILHAHMDFDRHL
jgi:toxin ParE1/3/4